MQIDSAATVLTVNDLDAALSYYKDVLGFLDDFRFGRYAGIRRDGIRLHLSEMGNPNATSPGSGAVYFFCDTVDGYYAEITARGAMTDGPPHDYPYGLRDFIARDHDGNQLTFGAPSAVAPSPV